jgi:alkylated DNA repair protein alkB family protein 4
MDDPIPLPKLLANDPARRASDPTAGGRIHSFDLDAQCAPSLPEFRGIRVYEEFLSSDEADRLLAEIETSTFKPAQSGKAKQHYGAKVNFNKRKLNTASFHGLPRYGTWIEVRARERAHADRSGSDADRRAMIDALARYETTDIFVLRYVEQDSSNLDFHRDDTFAYGDVILDLSLESDSVLSFIAPPRVEGNGQRSETTDTEPIECVRVPLPARSLAIVHGRARYKWDHAVLAYDIQGQRTSITMRTLSESLRRTEEGKRLIRVATATDAKT